MLPERAWDMAAEAQIKLAFGQVVHDADGAPWVFTNYIRTTTSHQLYFVKAGFRYHTTGFDYHATERATLVRKFPDIEAHAID